VVVTTWGLPAVGSDVLAGCPHPASNAAEAASSVVAARRFIGSLRWIGGHGVVAAIGIGVVAGWAQNNLKVEIIVNKDVVVTITS
jgi:hypothetical protein